MRSIAACLALAGVYGIVVLAWGWIWGYYELNLYTQTGAESIIHPGDSMYTISEAGFAGIFDLPWGVAPDWAGIVGYHLPNSVLSGLFVVAPFLLVYRLGLMRVVRYRTLWVLAIAVLLGFGYGVFSDFALAREEPDVVRLSWRVPCMVAMFACGVVLLAWESRGGRTAPGRVALKTLCALLCVAVFTTVGVAELPAEGEPTSHFDEGDEQRYESVVSEFAYLDEMWRGAAVYRCLYALRDGRLDAEVLTDHMRRGLRRGSAQARLASCRSWLQISPFLPMESSSDSSRLERPGLPRPSDVEAVVSTLGDLLVTAESEDLASVCNFVCGIGPDAEALAAKLAEVHGTVRCEWRRCLGEEALYALASIGARVEDVLPVVRRRFDTEDPSEIESALDVLFFTHGDKTRFVETMVLPRLATTPQDLRPLLRRAVVLLAPSHPRAIEMERDFLEDPETTTSVLDWIRNGHMDPIESLFPALTRHVGRRDTGFDRLLFDAVLAYETPEAVRTVAACLDDPDRAVTALQSFEAAGRLAELVAEEILARYPDYPDEVAAVLANVGRALTEHRPLLLEALEYSTDDRALDLAKALRLAGSAPEPCLEILTLYLGAVVPERRDAAARELGEWGDAAKGALPRLRKLRDEEGRLTAAIAAARIGSDEDVERAIEVARGRAMLRTAECHELRLLGSRAVPLVPDLTRMIFQWRHGPCRAMLGDEIPAIEFLGELGPEAREALPKLREAANCGPLERFATDAIRKIEAPTDRREK